MLLEAAHVHDAGDGGVVAQQHFTLWRDKIYAGYWMVEMLGDGQRLHVTDPTTTTCMNGIAYFIVALQDVYLHSLPGSRSGSRQACWPSTYNQYIYVFWHEYPSIKILFRSKISQSCHI